VVLRCVLGLACISTLASASGIPFASGDSSSSVLRVETAGSGR
jgi:hypothetical protein